ncbi:hypothetical protein HOY80DRAFT_1071145 [Tuber brumale]|nr:hypothetical protein HOY80DRAFT_1071145 [Tuber brumale]
MRSSRVSNWSITICDWENSRPGFDNVDHDVPVINVQALSLAPTHEHAGQILSLVETIGQFTEIRIRFARPNMASTDKTSSRFDDRWPIIFVKKQETALEIRKPMHEYGKKEATFPGANDGDDIDQDIDARRSGKGNVIITTNVLPFGVGLTRVPTSDRDKVEKACKKELKSTRDRATESRLGGAPPPRPPTRFTLPIGYCHKVENRCGNS